MRSLASLLLLGALAYAQEPQVAVISHRGEHLKHPENTLPAYLAAVGLGADYIEVDLRTTADGKLVLMHDSTVDRTTNGKGAVGQMTLEEIRNLDAGVKFAPHFAGTRVPLFEEVLSAVKGRVKIYVDAKNVAPAELVSALEKHNMLDGAVVYGGFQFLKELQQLRPQIKVMPESVNATVIRMLLEELKPVVIAFSEGDWQDEIISIAREAGVDIYVDRLGAQDTPAHWQDALERGATGIQTDKVGALLEFLRGKERHR